METLLHFASALLSAHAPRWIIGTIVIAIAVSQIGPIRLNLSIGDQSSRLRKPRTER